MANSPRVMHAVTQYGVVGSSVAPPPCNPISPEIQEIANKLRQMQLNFEVVDDTALINIARPSQNRPKKKPKHRARKDRRKKNNDCCISAGKVTPAMKYSRVEMVALRLADVEEQKKKWASVYGGLAASVAAEYDGLVVPSAAAWKNYGVSGFGFRRRPLLDNFEAAAAMGKRSPMKILVL